MPGMLSVKSKKGLDYMDMIFKTIDLCKSFSGQMAVNNISLNIKKIPSMDYWDRTELESLQRSK